MAFGKVFFFFSQLSSHIYIDTPVTLIKDLGTRLHPMTNTWSRVTQQLIARYFGAMACPHSQFLLRTKMFHFDTNPLPYVSCFIRWLRRAFHFHDASSANAQINYRAWGWSRRSTTYYGSGRPFWATVDEVDFNQSTGSESLELEH